MKKSKAIFSSEDMCQPHLDAADRDRILQAVFQGESPKGYCFDAIEKEIPVLAERCAERRRRRRKK